MNKNNRKNENRTKAPELEWRALVHLANIKHFNNRSIGIANDSNDLKFAILKLISQLEREDH